MRMVACFCLAMMVTNNSVADLVFEFGQSTYNVVPGETVDVELYVSQTAGETVLSDFGLFSAAANVYFNEPPVPTDPAVVQSLADISINPAFDDPFFTEAFLDPGVSAGFSAVIGFGSPEVFATSDRILLATFTFTAGSVFGEQTFLRATDLDPVFDETIAGNGQILDGQLSDGFATINAVPEVSQLLGVSLLLFATLNSRRKRRPLPC